MAESLINANLHATQGSFTLDISLLLPAQGFSVIFGHSGSGKTTFLRCLAGLTPCSGTLAVGGEVWQDSTFSKPPETRPVGMVFQDARLFPHLDTHANLRFGWQRIAPHERRLGFDDVVAWLGLGSLLSRRVHSLSGGEQQRVAIARALLTSPRLLLMDEPVASLDPQGRNEVLSCLQDLRARLDIPVIYVTHSTAELTRLADHAAVFDQGRVAVSGPLSEALTRQDSPLIFLDEASGVLQAKVSRHDTEYALSELLVGNMTLWTSQCQLAPGTPVRLRIFARDVSLALTPPTGSSIQNLLPATIRQLQSDADAAQLMVHLDVNGQVLLARITRRAADQLRIEAGTGVYAQIKAVSLEPIMALTHKMPE